MAGSFSFIRMKMAKLSKKSKKGMHLHLDYLDKTFTSY